MGNSPYRQEFIDALIRFDRVCQDYKRETGANAVLVGGAAVEFFSFGSFASGDFDFIVPDLPRFSVLMENHNFQTDEKRGWFCPDVPGIGFECVSGQVMDGAADLSRTVSLSIKGYQSALELIPLEDLIADRMAQQETLSPTDCSMINQAYMLGKKLGKIDEAYLQKRIHDEGGCYQNLLTHRQEYP